MSEKAKLYAQAEAARMQGMNAGLVGAGPVPATRESPLAQLHGQREYFSKQIERVDRMIALLDKNPEMLDLLVLARELHIR